MTVILKSLRVDAKRVNDGVWIERPGIAPGVAVKVRSIHYRPYDIARSLLTRRFARGSKGEPLATVDINPEVGGLLAEHILLDWRGFDEPYSPELAQEMLTDPEFGTLTQQVELAAMEAGEADIQFVKDAGKNSGPPSGGG